MNAILAKQDDGTIQLTITIPADVVKKTWDETVQAFAKQAVVPGFRKGKAPQNMVEDQINQERIKEEVLKKLLPKYYIEAVQHHKINPIINPKIHVEKLDESTPTGKDWVFVASTAEAPNVVLTGYKDAIQKVTAKTKIILPGQEKQEPKFEDIMKALLDSVTIEIPQVLISYEADRLLAQTLDDVKKLGMSLDQYLTSTGRTAETLRADYEQKAAADLKLEFTLQKIAEVEKIAVEEKEVDEAIMKAKDENERKNLESNRYLLASIIRQQKTLDFLKNL